jgi:hypothetical protein
MICAAWKEKKKNFQGYFSISGKCLKWFSFFIYYFLHKLCTYLPKIAFMETQYF